MLPITHKTAALRGIGVDLVSRARVRQFLSRHEDYVRDRFLNVSERRSFRRLSCRDFAELFAAKEAFFKACGESWMGLEGFQGMRMKRRAGDYFEMEWRPAYKTKRGSSHLKNSKKGRPAHSRKTVYRGEGHFFRSGDLVGAQAMIWK